MTIQPRNPSTGEPLLSLEETRSCLDRWRPSFLSKTPKKPLERPTMPFGLGAAVFTRNAEVGLRIAAEELEAGGCFVNTFVRSDPRLRFGVIKESGYCRELSHYGIREFVNVKTVFVK